MNKVLHSIYVNWLKLYYQIRTLTILWQSINKISKAVTLKNFKKASQEPNKQSLNLERKRKNLLIWTMNWMREWKILRKFSKNKEWRLIFTNLLRHYWIRKKQRELWQCISKISKEATSKKCKKLLQELRTFKLKIQMAIKIKLKF